MVTLANELKHTNEHLNRHEEKIEAIESQPKMRMQQIVTAIKVALAESKGWEWLNPIRETERFKNLLNKVEEYAKLL